MQPLGGVATADQARAWLETQRVHWREHGFGRYFVRCGEEVVGLVRLSLCLEEPGARVAHARIRGGPGKATTRGPPCQCPVRQCPLETYLPMGGDWTGDRAEADAYSRTRIAPQKRAA